MTAISAPIAAEVRNFYCAGWKFSIPEQGQDSPDGYYLATVRAPWPDAANVTVRVLQITTCLQNCPTLLQDSPLPPVYKHWTQFRSFPDDTLDPVIFETTWLDSNKRRRWRQRMWINAYNSKYEAAWGFTDNPSANLATIPLPTRRDGKC